MNNGDLSYEYIRGLVESEGLFTFSTNRKLCKKIPAFVIKMTARDKYLIEMIRDKIGLKNKIYEYNYQKNDGYRRKPIITLIVREIGSIRNIIIPFFYKKLRGNKARQFEEWLEKIGNDPEVPKSYKFIYKLYKEGYYEKYGKFRE